MVPEWSIAGRDPGQPAPPASAPEARTVLLAFPTRARHPAPATRRQRPRVAVIGTGPGGLAATLLLARAGLDVVGLERGEAVGGRTRTVSAPGGYRFDIGPTFFLYPRALRALFAPCGEDFDEHVELRRLDPLYRLVFEGGGELEAAADPERLAAGIARFAPEDARNIGAFLADNRVKLKAFQPVLERPFGRLADYLAPEVLKALRLLRPHRTVDHDLRRYFSDPRVRLAFSFQTKSLGMSPFRCPSLFTILSFLKHEHGVYHPIGGCGAVSEAMARLARGAGRRQRLGADIRLRTSAERVEFAAGRPVAVETGRGRVPVDAVVVGADFAHAIPTLIPEAHRPRWRDGKIGNARLSCSDRK